jgi:hypothetical protein
MRGVRYGARTGLAALVALAGCGGGQADSPPAARTPAATSTPSPSPSPTPAPSGPTAERRTIDRWAKAVARADFEGAAALFALPAEISQSAEPVRLRTRAELELFNATLPCGAKLLDARREDRYVVATFRLTDRVGSRCDGPGGKARVAFAFRGGRISEWRRLPAGEAPPAASETA